MEWVSIKDRLPQIGETTHCKVRFHSHGSIHHEEELIATYRGIIKSIDMPMWEIDTGDEAFAEVTHWTRRKAKLQTHRMSHNPKGVML